MKRSRPALSILVFAILILAGTAWVRAPADGPVKRKVTAEDLPRVPPTPPAEALKTFRLARGFKLEMVAAEPLVADPVDACFDEFGRMYVAEMHGYPFSQEPTKLNPAGGGKKDAGIIRRLEDTDGDGRMDKSVVFADRISWPTSVCCYNGGVFVIAPQYLYYFKDTDGDGKADVREVILSGFGRDNVQSVVNGLEWMLDNKITFAAGRNPKRLLHRGKPLFSVGSSDIRFDPKTEKFERVTGGSQFGHSTDDWGVRFVCSNSDHIQQVVFPQRYLARNPYLAASGLIRSIATDGASARVFRISPPEPWRIIRQKWRAEAKGYKLVINKEGGWEFIPIDPSAKKGAIPTEYPVGYFTSATGITIYRGDAYPPEFRGNAFVGDVGGNLVHRKRLRTDRVVYKADRADPGEEFVRSTDNWFRPVNFVNAPDGTLYVLDMYRETVEHPYSIPDEIKKFLHLTSGQDRGRIYRLVSPGMKRARPEALGKLTSRELVRRLGSDNGWVRRTAQRLLWERQDREVMKDLTAFLTSTPKPLGRLHTLYALKGLNALTPNHVRRALKDEHPRVRAHAIRLCEPFLKSSGDLVAALLPLCEDDSEHVRFQLAFTLGETSDKRAIEGLARLARDPRNGPEVRTALLSSVGRSADRLASALFEDRAFLGRAHAAGLLAQLGQIAGANEDPAPALRLLASATATDLPLSIQQAVLTGLGEGLGRRGSSITRLLEDKTASPGVRKQVADLFQRAARLAGEGRPIRERVVAVRLLAFADFKTASEALPAFLSPRTPPPLQIAAVEALGRQDSDEVATTLLKGWPTYTPQVRRTVIDVLLTTAGRIQKLLAAVKSKAVQPGDVERDKKQLLMHHPNARVRAASREVFGREVSSDRAKVVREYQDVLRLEGDAKHGLAVFTAKCAICHRVGETGHKVAPDLESVQNKSSADLLVAILDPNREAQPNFNVYTVMTKKGRIYTGLIQAETASSITLLRAEAKKDVVLRSSIAELASSGVSLMPEGLEKDLSRQDLADVISFVQSIKPKGSKAPKGK